MYILNPKVVFFKIKTVTRAQRIKIIIGTGIKKMVPLPINKNFSGNPIIPYPLVIIIDIPEKRDTRGHTSGCRRYYSSGQN